MLPFCQTRDPEDQAVVEPAAVRVRKDPDGIAGAEHVRGWQSARLHLRRLVVVAGEVHRVAAVQFDALFE